MNNAELIKGLRWCADESICCDDFSGEKCPYFDEKKDSCSVDEILHAAADALEAAEQRIAELEDDLRNDAISNPERFKIYGYTVKDLLLFADMCKRNDVQESDLKQAAWNLELDLVTFTSLTFAINARWIWSSGSGKGRRISNERKTHGTE